MSRTTVAIIDAAAMVVGDSAVTSGKAWFQLKGFGDAYFNANGAILDEDFSLGEISKGAKVTVYYRGDLPKKNRDQDAVHKVETLSGKVVWKS